LVHCASRNSQTKFHIPEQQWLVTDYVAGIMSNALAVFLSIATKSLFNIVKRLIGIWSTNPTVKDVIEESHSPEGLGGVIPAASQVGTPTRRYRFWLKQFWSDMWSNFRQRPYEILSLLLTMLLMGIIFLGGILAGVFSSLVVTDSVAVSAHPAVALSNQTEHKETSPTLTRGSSTITISMKVENMPNGVIMQRMAAMAAISSVEQADA
jgi:hypothetical protein